MSTVASRYHDISVGHRVHGHESKCKHLHGHNYRVHFDIEAPSLDKVGRVMDFSVLKEKLCMWLEDNWDHKFLAWQDDQVMRGASQAFSYYNSADQWGEELGLFLGSLVFVPFNPTAENMAEYLVKVVGPRQLEGTGCVLIKCVIEETRKCSVSCTIDKKELCYHD